jgi:AraC-like DNA-binding protein
VVTKTILETRPRRAARRTEVVHDDDGSAADDACARVAAAASRGRREMLQRHKVIDTADVTEAATALSEVFVPLTLSPAWRRHTMDMCLNALALNRVTVGYLRFGVDTRIVTDELANFHVDVALAGASRWQRGGRREIVTAPGEACVFTPGTGAELSWASETEQLCVMLDRAELERELGRLLGRPLSDPLVLAESMRTRSTAGRAWLRILYLIVAEARHDTGLLRNPLATARLEQLLVDGLLLNHRHNYSDQLLRQDTGSFPSTRRAGMRAVDAVQGRPEHPWTTAELAAHAEVGARTLQKGFREATGMSPMAYLKVVRLDRVRDELSAAGPRGTTVAAVAARWGFVHLGRFAEDYRRRHGELPSVTLRGRAP